MNEVEGTVWDPDSIMHYPFEKGLIKEPIDYYQKGLHPAGGLSSKDKSWVKYLYPQIDGKTREKVILASQSVLLKLSAGEQENLVFLPEESRYYTFQTFGKSDAVMVLFEDENGELKYRTGEDDGGKEENATFKVKLFKGHRYILRIRLYYAERVEGTAVMVW